MFKQSLDIAVPWPEVERAEKQDIAIFQRDAEAE